MLKLGTNSQRLFYRELITSFVRFVAVWFFVVGFVNLLNGLALHLESGLVFGRSSIRELAVVFGMDSALPILLWVVGPFVVRRAVPLDLEGYVAAH